jgi:hypothetical protein
MKFNRNHGLWIEYRSRLYGLSAIEMSDEDASKHIAAHPNDSLIDQHGPFLFLANVKDGGLRVPDPEDGAPTRKVLGYANGETAAIILNVDNDAVTQARWLDVARDGWSNAEADGSLTRRDKALLAIADTLEEDYEDKRPGNVDGNDIYSELLSKALGRVEWTEVAEHLLTKMEEHDRPQPAE